MRFNKLFVKYENLIQIDEHDFTAYTVLKVVRRLNKEIDRLRMLSVYS